MTLKRFFAWRAAGYAGVALLCAGAMAASAAPVAEARPTNALPSKPTPERQLTLPEAIDRALAASPHLASVVAGLEGAEGAAEQAGFRPNPALRLEAENLGGTGPYRGLDGTVYTLSVSQKLELGGKRSHRSSAARKDIELEQLRVAEARLRLIQSVQSAYVRVIAAREQLQLAREHHELAQTLLVEVEKRVQAAREPALQLSKAQIAVATARLAENEQARELQHAQHVLASFWLGGHERYNYDATGFFELTEPVTEEQMEAQLGQHPTVAYWQIAQQRQQALVRLAKADALPDPNVELGVRQFAETGDQALVVGFSMALPVFDRNQGNVRRARAALNQSESDEQAAALDLTAQGLQALEEMINAYQRARTLSATIVPAAERAFTLAREGYSAGRFPYIEVLDAQRTLFDAKQAYIAALEEYQLAKARVEFVLATHLAE